LEKSLTETQNVKSRIEVEKGNQITQLNSQIDENMKLISTFFSI